MFDPIAVTENSFETRTLICPFMTQPYIVGKLKTGEIVASSNTEYLKDYYTISEELYNESFDSPLTNNIISLNV
jgi:hypothetical protein